MCEFQHAMKIEATVQIKLISKLGRSNGRKKGLKKLTKKSNKVEIANNKEKNLMLSLELEDEVDEFESVELIEIKPNKNKGKL